jgi:hypothetical protein
MSLMPRRVAFWILVPAVLSFAGCGGGSPAAPRPVAATPTPAPAPTPVPSPVAVDGLTHEVVAAEITPAAPALRSRVTARAPECLLREQPYDGGPIFLWKVEEDYANALVYPLTFTDGSFRMVRWAGPFTLTLDQGLDQNDTVMRKTQEVVAEVTRHTGMPITIGPNGAVHVMIDPNILSDDSAVGQAIRSFRGATIVGGTIKFAAVQDPLGTNSADYTNVFLHEMGHIMGLGPRRWRARS